MDSAGGEDACMPLRWHAEPLAKMRGHIIKGKGHWRSHPYLGLWVPHLGKESRLEKVNVDPLWSYH